MNEELLRLKKQVKVLRVCLITLACLVLAPLLVGADDDHLLGRSLRLLDRKGSIYLEATAVDDKPTIVLKNPEQNSRASMELTLNKARAPTVALFDHFGNRRCEMGLSYPGKPYLIYRHSDGTAQLSLNSTVFGKPELTLFNEKGVATIRLRQGPGPTEGAIELKKEKGKPVPRLFVLDEEGEVLHKIPKK